MSMYSTVLRLALILAILAPLAVPAAGFAHALFADHDPNRPVLAYVWIGFWHMVGGWQVNATVVDAVIALSLVYVGIQGLMGRPKDFRMLEIQNRQG